MPCDKSCKMKEVKLERPAGQPLYHRQIFRDGKWRNFSAGELPDAAKQHFDDQEGAFDAAQNAYIKIVPVDGKECPAGCRCAAIAWGAPEVVEPWSAPWWYWGGHDVEGAQRASRYYTRRTIRLGKGVCDEKPAQIALELPPPDEHDSPALVPA